MPDHQQTPQVVRVGDDVHVMNLDGTVAYSGRVIHVGAAVTVRAHGSNTAIVEHPDSIRPADVVPARWGSPGPAGAAVAFPQLAAAPNRA